MKIALTGSAGNITKPLAEALLAQGHQVTVIGRSSKNLTELTDKGATAAIGSIEDKGFLQEAFQGADAVYTMVPVPFHLTDWVRYHETIATNYAHAIKINGIKKVVNLSSYGAHRSEGIGPTAALARVEKVLNTLKDTTVIHLRPGYFYSNLINQIPAIKNFETISANYGNPTAQLLLVHHQDIAPIAAQALTDEHFNSQEPYYIVSDARPYRDIARVLGKAIGKEDLKWTQFSDEDFKNGLKAAGLSDALADIYVEIGQKLEKGLLQEHYASLPTKPALGQVKLEAYAEEFANLYSQSH